MDCIPRCFADRKGKRSWCWNVTERRLGERPMSIRQGCIRGTIIRVPFLPPRNPRVILNGSAESIAFALTGSLKKSTQRPISFRGQMESSSGVFAKLRRYRVGLSRRNTFSRITCVTGHFLPGNTHMTRCF